MHSLVSDAHRSYLLNGELFQPRQGAGQQANDERGRGAHG